MKISFESYFNIHSPGYVIATLKNHQKNTFVFGNREIKPEIKECNKDTLYDIASLTKTYTAVLIYKAFEEGMIDLNATISHIEPKFKHLQDVSVLDLLGHQVELWTNGYLGTVNDLEEFMNILYSAKVREYRPCYTDVHYIILAILLEKIYDESFINLLNEKVLKPLHLKHTTFFPKGDNIASNNFEWKDGVEITNIYPGVIHDQKARKALELGIGTGHASLFTTAEGLLSFLEQVFFSHTFLKPETIEIMLTHGESEIYNRVMLSKYVSSTDLNQMYLDALEKGLTPPLASNYNFMGARYRHEIKAKNDVPEQALSNSIVFSGFTGPCYVVDFERNIIIVLMCNAIHNSKINRLERKKLLDEIMNQLYEELLCH